MKCAYCRQEIKEGEDTFTLYCFALGGRIKKTLALHAACELERQNQTPKTQVGSLQNPRPI